MLFAAQWFELWTGCSKRSTFFQAARVYGLKFAYEFEFYRLVYTLRIDSRLMMVLATGWLWMAGLVGVMAYGFYFWVDFCGSPSACFADVILGLSVRIDFEWNVIPILEPALLMKSSLSRAFYALGRFIGP
jgi:hypothetical protein